MPSNVIPRVGVTGGIGSGKSTVCTYFERLGRPVLSADLIARDIMDHDLQVRTRIEEEFGKQIYSDEGVLRRKELAAIVFKDPAARKKLNSLVHPFVFAEIDRLVAAITPHPPYVIIEAALIYEAGMDKRLDAVIVVRASAPTRLERIIVRDTLSMDEAVSRMRSQEGMEAKARNADFFIDNEGPEGRLAEKTAFIDRILVSLLEAGTLARN
jgi:dephospho-CoA kinase